MKLAMHQVGWTYLYWLYCLNLVGSTRLLILGWRVIDHRSLLWWFHGLWSSHRNVEFQHILIVMYYFDSYECVQTWVFFFYNLNVSQAWTPMIVATLLILSFWWSHQIFSLWLCHPKANMNPSMSPNLHHMKFFFFVLSACACFLFYYFKLNEPFYIPLLAPNAPTCVYLSGIQ